MTMLQDKVIKTRTIHVCVWFWEDIDAEEEGVQYRVYVLDGDFMWEWWHPECWEAVKRVPYEEVEDGFCTGTYSRGGVEYKG